MAAKKIAPALPAAHRLTLLSRSTLARVAYGVLGVICLDSGLALCYACYREGCIDAALEEAYPDSDSDDEKFIKCPDAEKRFESVVKSSPGAYSTVVGSHGTSKSTLARNVARKTQGAIYVNVPPTVKTDDSEYPVKEVLNIWPYVRPSVGVAIYLHGFLSS